MCRRATRDDGRRDTSLYDVAQRELCERYGYTLHEEGVA